MKDGHSMLLKRRARRRFWLAPFCCITISLCGNWLLGATPKAAAGFQEEGPSEDPNKEIGQGHEPGVQPPKSPGALGRWRDRTRVFSSWQVMEAPFWHVARGHTAGDSAARASVLRQALLGQAPAAEDASRRLQLAVDAVCGLLQYFGVRGPSSEDVEAYVSSDVLPPQGHRQGPMWAIPAGPFPRVMLVASPELMQRLSDAELRALVGLHLGRLLQGPQLSGARQLGGWWLLHRVYQTLNSELPDLPDLEAFFAQPLEESMKTGLGPALRAILRDAAVIEVSSRVGRLRNIQLIKAADRFALISGGSVEAASSAIAKVHDYASEGLALELRCKSMQQWAATPRGQRLLLVGRHFAQPSTPRERPRSKHWALASATVALVLVSGMLVSAGLAAMVLNSLLTVSAALAVVATSTFLGAPEAQKATIASLMLCSAGAVLVWWRCAKLGARGGSHTTVTALVQEALPAAAEAAAGAALLAQCSGSIRRRPLGELDHELRSHWTTSLRGLSAKLADLRRLVGAGDAGGAMGEVGAARLCAKLDLEVRRALSAELLWMKGALDLENEGALCRALFWWLHDDGEHGAWGSPRPASTAAQLGCEPSTLEKLSYPSLANAGVGHKNLQEPTPDHERTTEEVMRAAVALAAQHHQLEWLRAALHPSDGTSPPTDFDPSPGTPPLALSRLFSSGYANRRAEAKVREFLEQCEGVQSKSQGYEGSYGRCWEAALLLNLFAAVAALRAAWLCRQVLVAFAGGWWCFGLQVMAFLLANVVLQLRLLDLRLPYLWARLERCLLALASERAQLVELVRLPGRSRADQLAHLKALMLMQGVRTAQNLDHLALCVEAEALRSAASSERSGRGGQKVLLNPHDAMNPKDTDIYQYRRSCLQLFYAVLPRHGRRGQRQVSSDTDIYQAMAWFDVQSQRRAFSVGGALPARLKALQLALATSQRQLWMLFRLCNVRSMARPVAEQGTLSALLNCQLRPIVLERKLELEALLPSRGAAPEEWLRRPTADSGRILGDLDSTTGSNEDGSDVSSLRSGVARRILASGSTTPAQSEGRGADRREAELRSDLRADEDAWDGASSDAASVVEGEGVHRILAASDASDGASSDSASSAGFNSFGVTHSSMWSGMSHSAASSTSSLAEDMLTHRRPLLEGYAHALRPLFMTRGDIMHLLAKFPTQVLMGGAAAGTRSFAAHRELLEELFGSFLVAVKSPERRGKIKLAFGTSFTYHKAPYTVGPVQTTVQLVAHGVRRTGHEPFPVVYEDEHEDEERSEAAVSAARDEGGQEGHGVLEFEEIVVPLSEVSSRELFLAELMQSDQCQLLASLSQGAHSKYGQRALRRRRRTLRHVREATQLLVNVPDQ